MMANPHVLIEGVVITSYAIRAGARLHLPARRGRARPPPAAGGGRRGLRAGLPRQGHPRLRLRPRHHRARRRRRLHLRRGDGAARLARGPPRPAAAAPAVPGRRRPLRLADRRQQRRVDRQRPVDRRHGADWFRGHGHRERTRKAPRATLFSLSGHVTRPGQYEAPLGITLRELLDLAGGMREGHQLKFWTPGGSSTPMLTAEHLDIPLDFEGVAGAGSMLGTKALQIFDETTCVVRAVLRWTEFYAHESCGKCTPCREGTYWLVQILRRLEHGTGRADGRGPRQAARHLRQHPRPLVLRARRRRDQPDHLVARVLPRRVRRALRARRLPVRPGRLDAVRVGRSAGSGERPMTVTRDTSSGAAGAAARRPGHRHDRRLRGHRAQGHAGDPRRRAARHPDPAVLRPPAARPGRRLPAVPRRGRRASPSRWRPARTTVADGMVVKTQLTSPVADKAQQGVMELLLINHPLDCPVCDKGGECPLQNQAMSNGRGETRFADVKRTFPKPITISTQVLLDRERCVLCARCTRFSDADRRRPVHRAARARRAAAGRHLRGPAVRVLLLRQHRADLPGRRADRRRVPLPRPARSTWSPRPASASTAPSGCALRTDHRRGKVLRRLAGDDPAVNEEWNCDKGRWAFPYATAPDRLTTPLVRDRDGRAGAGVVARGARRRGRAAWPRRRGGAGVLAGGRLDRRGRLRLRQVRPGRARHQRRRLPRPPALRRGGGVPRRARRRHRARASPTPTSSTRPSVLLVGLEPEEESPIVFLRLRKAVAQPGLARRRGRAVRQPRPGQARRRRCSRPPPAPRPRCWTPCGSRDEPVARRGRSAPRGRRRHPRRRAAGAVARRAVRGGPAGRRPPAPGWPGCRAGPASAARVEAGALPGLLPGGRPVADAAARVDVAAAWGVDALPADRRAATPPAILAAAAAGELGAPARRRRRPRTTCPTPPPRWPRSTPRRSWSASSCGPARSPSAPTSCCRSRPPAEKAGTFLDWEGRAAAVRRRRCASTAHARRCGCCTSLADAMGVALRLPDVAAARARARRARAPGTGARAGRPRRGRRRSRRRPAPARPCSRPGRCCSTPAGCRTASRTSPAPPAAPSPGCPPATAAALGVADGDAGHRRAPTAARSRSRSRSPTCPTAWSGCRPTRRGCAGPRRRSAPTPATS